MFAGLSPIHELLSYLDFNLTNRSLTLDSISCLIEAREIAYKDAIKVTYFLLHSLQKELEHNVILALKKSSSFPKSSLIIFYAPNSDVWHIVYPRFINTQPVLYRFVLGPSESHAETAKRMAKIKEAMFCDQRLLDKVFNVKDLHNHFLSCYTYAHSSICNTLSGSGFAEKSIRQYSHRVLYRLIILHFLQKKPYIFSSSYFVQWFLESYHATRAKNMLHRWFNALFFEILCRPPHKRNVSMFPKEMHATLFGIPFLNEDIFLQDPLDEVVELPDELFLNLINDFLAKFNFTLSEPYSNDVDIAISPEVLSFIYETIVMHPNRGGEGIFYTPRAEVSFMCRIALTQFLDALKKQTPYVLQRVDLSPNNSQCHSLILPDYPIEQILSSSNHAEEYLSSMRQLRIIDPACGCGIFLVEMFRLLVTILKDKSSNDAFQQIQEILLQNLYGVDIKRWAVKLTQIRLWLAFLDQVTATPPTGPIFPKLSLQIRTGDSILQPFEWNIVTRTNFHEKMIIRSLLLDFEKQKLDFALCRGVSEETIYHEQKKLLCKWLELQTKFLLRKTRTPQSTPNQQKMVEILQTIQRELKTVPPGTFLWLLAFPEVLLRGGFHIVLSNPPYIRQEYLGHQKGDSSLQKGLVLTECKYKDQSHTFVKRLFGRNLSKQSDLYVYFFFRAFDILNENGCLVFITSSSWLDVSFGRELKLELLEQGSCTIIDVPQRCFPAAGINTVITIVARNRKTSSSTINFLSCGSPTFSGEIRCNKITLNPSNEQPNFETLEILTTKNLRLVKVPKVLLEPSLLAMPTSSPTSIMKTFRERWNIYLRAPVIFFKLMNDCKRKLLPIQKIMFIKRGFTTGANDFFFLPLPGSSHRYFYSEYDPDSGQLHLFVKENQTDEFLSQGFSVREPMFCIEKEYWMHPLERNTFPSQYPLFYESDEIWIPNYLLDHTRSLTTFILNPSSFESAVLLIPNQHTRLQSGIREFIEWGENWRPNNGPPFARRMTCRARSCWFSLKPQPPFDVILLRFRDQRSWTPILTCSTFVSDAVFGGAYYDQSLIDANNALLNSILHLFSIELLGRVGLGEGILSLCGPELKHALILDAKTLTPNQKDELESAFSRMKQRKIVSILDEFGIGKNGRDYEDFINNLTLDDIPSWRFELDRIVFESLNLKTSEQLAVYRAYVSLVAGRVAKAKRFGEI